MGERRRIDVDAVLGLLWLGWGVGTPYCLYVAAISAAAFFGETPSEAQLAESQQYLAGGLVCGLLLPVVGILLGRRLRRPVTAWAFAGALALTVSGLGYVVFLTS